MNKYLFAFMLAACAHTNTVVTSKECPKCQESVHSFNAQEGICPAGTYIDMKDYDYVANQRLYLCRCKRGD